MLAREQAAPDVLVKPDELQPTLANLIERVIYLIDGEPELAVRTSGHHVRVMSGALLEIHSQGHLCRGGFMALFLAHNRRISLKYSRRIGV